MRYRKTSSGADLLLVEVLLPAAAREEILAKPMLHRLHRWRRTIVANMVALINEFHNSYYVISTSTPQKKRFCLTFTANPSRKDEGQTDTAHGLKDTHHSSRSTD